MGDTGLENRSGARGFCNSDASAPPKTTPVNIGPHKKTSQSKEIHQNRHPMNRDDIGVCDKLPNDSISYVTSKWELLPENVKQTILMLIRVSEAENHSQFRSLLYSIDSRNWEWK